LLFKTNRSAESLTYFQTAAKIKADNPDVHYQLFLIYTRLKRKAEADQEFKLFKQLTDKAAVQNVNKT
jgi:Flp pilus assembly protein TadD